VFELQSALAKKDMAKSLRIVTYFESNPKAAPIQLILPSLYGFFSKVFMVFGAPSKEEKAIAAAIGVNPFFAKDYLHAARVYDYQGVEKVLLLLHQYNLKSIGIHNAGTEDASLLKEMIYKMMA
jgi:DNA polymerase-3 subunit delta